VHREPRIADDADDLVQSGLARACGLERGAGDEIAVMDGEQGRVPQRAVVVVERAVDKHAHIEGAGRADDWARGGHRAAMTWRTA
jgi:hypothetical protein